VKNNFDIAIKTYDLMNSTYPEKLKKLEKKINLKYEEIEVWKECEKDMCLGYDPDTKLYEQFRGYFDLEYIDLNDYEPRSIPMDIILGREKIEKTQVIKQADVLMFMTLFGERFSQEELIANYEFYEKRCGHGSSLSPGIHCIAAARAGKAGDAYRYFLKNAKIDIGDEFGNASGGIHIASLGGVWMSVVFGFAGMYSTEKGLIFNPCLPVEWDNIEFSVKWRKQKINVILGHNKIDFFVAGNKNIYLSTGFNNWKEIDSGICYSAVKIDQKWEWKE